MLVQLHFSNPAAKPVFQVALQQAGQAGQEHPSTPERFFQAVGQNFDSKLTTDCQSLVLLSQIFHILILKNFFRIADTALVVCILRDFEEKAADPVSQDHHLASLLLQQDKDEITQVVLDAVGGVSRDRVNLFRLPKPYTDAM